MITTNYIHKAPEALLVPLVIYGTAMYYNNLHFQVFAILVLMCMLLFYRGANIPKSIIQAAVNRNALLCPCDGKVLKVVQNTNGKIHIAIFLNIHNVHVQYVPISGTVKSVFHKDGEFHPAYLFEKSAYNERVETTIYSDIFGDVMIMQIAGLVARRILSFHHAGARVKIGEPLGLIKFGSRVDVLVDYHKSLQIHVKEGDRIKIGDTLITKISPESKGHDGW